jgi:hypothetical protein
VVDLIELRARGRWTWEAAGLHAREVYWHVGTYYSRSDPSEAFAYMPVVGTSADHLVYGTPLWLVHALAGTESAELDPTNGIRGPNGPHLRACVSIAAATSESTVALNLPTRFGRHFAAEVWLDHAGLIFRMSCNWPPRFRLLQRRSQAVWNTTELSDFGVSIPDALASEGLEPPAWPNTAD